MAQDDATFDALGGEPTPTPEAAPPIPADFMSSVMARFARQDEFQKTTNDQLAALVAALTAQDGQTSRPQMIRRRLFNTNPPATGGDHISDDSEPNETLPLHVHRQREDGYMYIVNENNVPISTMVVRGEGWNKWVRELDSSGEPTDTVWATQPAVAAGPTACPSRTFDLSKHCKYYDVKGHDTTECKSLYAHYLSSLASGDFKFEPLKAKPWSKNKERRAQRKATGKGRQNETQQRNEEKIPKDDGEEEYSADEEQPANRRRIEVIPSQQTLSSDDENDDAPIPGDLRDVLKRKLESKDDNSSGNTDLRLTLNARKSQHTSTGVLIPKGIRHVSAVIFETNSTPACAIFAFSSTA
ncbi:hypothetical protein DY000_02041388 [Brassica cretica]|uniref:Uncharacterized protein n=1 Tax=Brassica cretica TaxID=69181 RepID=A0ABQ7BMC2_BRACR|nr:hypothetical protein DY000_02041388 [Brassica cretica]